MSKTLKQINADLDAANRELAELDKLLQMTTRMIQARMNELSNIRFLCNHRSIDALIDGASVDELLEEIA